MNRFIYKSNCWIFWLKMFARHGWNAGLFTFKSDYGWWGHVMFVNTRTGVVMEFTPIAPKRKLKWWEMPKALLFEGREKEYPSMVEAINALNIERKHHG